MRRPVSSALLAVLALLGALPGAAAAANPTVTNMADDARTGWYPDQAGLSRDAVGSTDFGELFATQLRGQIYAQPLVSNGVLLVATESNQISGLNPQSGAIRWQRELGTPFDPSNIDGKSCGDLAPEVGVTSTPVIDPTGTGTAYLTSKRAGGAYYMEALDLATGETRPGFPVKIEGSADNHPETPFNGTYQLQRPGLLLKDGVVYAGFGGHCDIGRYHGWIVGVSTTGTIASRWVTPPAPMNGAGIWQTGSGLVSDGPNRILLSTGNSVWKDGTPGPDPVPGDTPPAGLAESVIRLAVGPDKKLEAVDFFAPSDAEQLDTWDADFSSGGPVALPSSYGTPEEPKPLAIVGKKGIVYLLDRDDLGGHKQGPTGGDRIIHQTAQRGGVWSKPSLWPGDGGYLSVPTASSSESASGSSGFLDVYKREVADGKPVLVRVATSPDEFGFGSSAPVVTSDGDASGSGLLWIINSPYGGHGAELRVYDAKPASQSYEPLRRWAIGRANKFTPPGVGDRRLYVGTREGVVRGFGSPVEAAMTATGGDVGEVVSGQTGTGTVTLRAQRDLTLQAIGVDPGSEFRLGASSPSVPRTVLAGQTVDVPVELAAGAPGSKGGTLRVATSQGEVLVSLSGTVRSSTGYLTRSAAVVGFGGVVVGTERTDTALFRNTGSEAVTVTEVDDVAGPVTTSGIPAAPFTIPKDGTVVVTFRYAPTAVGTYSDTLRLETNGAEPEENREIGVTGTAQTPARLELEPASLQMPFGDVVLGLSSTQPLTVRNTGGAALQIMKSKPPAGGSFTAEMIPEGTTIQGGQAVRRDVTFRPQALGRATDTWVFTATSGEGAKTVEMSGTGTTAPTPAPSPVAEPLPPAPPLREQPPTPLRGDEPPPPAPVISGLKLGPAKFRPLTGKGASVEAYRARRLTRGSTLSFRLTRPARVRFTAGVVTRPRCKGSRTRRCPVFRPVRGVFAVEGRAGLNRLVFTGRLSGRALRRGTYRMIARPAGGADATAAFTVR